MDFEIELEVVLFFLALLIAVATFIGLFLKSAKMTKWPDYGPSMFETDKEFEEELKTPLMFNKLPDEDITQPIEIPKSLIEQCKPINKPPGVLSYNEVYDSFYKEQLNQMEPSSPLIFPANPKNELLEESIALMKPELFQHAVRMLDSDIKSNSKKPKNGMLNITVKPVKKKSKRVIKKPSKKKSTNKKKSSLK